MSNPSAVRTHMPDARNAMLRTYGRTNGLTNALQDQCESSRVPDAPMPVDNEVEVAVSRAEVLRTRVTLARLQGRQEQLRDGLNRSGLSSVADRLDWLHAQKSPDEALAWRRRWRDLGLTDEPAPVEVFARPQSLSLRKSRRKKPAPVIPRDRQLEIALAVMAAKEARQGREQEAA